MRIEQFQTLAKTDFEVNWIVEDLISSGQWTYFVGPPGSGKSMLAIQLCAALQEGLEFLGRRTLKHNCLYIQSDAGISEWKTQVKNLAGDSFAWTVHDMQEFFIDDPNRVEYQHQVVWGTYPHSEERGSLSQVLKHVPYTFVVFDCLNKITEHDLNTKVAASHITKNLDYICTKYTCSKCEVEVKGNTRECPNCEESLEGNKKRVQQVHYMLIHHPTAGKTRGVEAGSGSKVFSAVCGNMLTLANSILVLEKCKIARNVEIKLERGNKGEWYIQSAVMTKKEESDLEELLGLSL